MNFRILRKEKQFMKLIFADMINRFGDSIDAIAMVWLVYQLTQSASFAAVIFGLNMIPTILIQPFAGAFIEKKNKKMTMIWMDILRGICVGSIAFLLAFSFLRPWMLILSTLLISTAEAFRNPASAGIFPQIIKKENYEFGIAASKTLTQVTTLVGTALAGTVIGLLGLPAAVLIDMATFFLSAIVITGINTSVKKKELDTERLIFGRKKGKNIKEEWNEYKGQLKEGLLFIRQNEMLSFYLLLAVFLNAVLVPFNSLQAPLVQDVLHSGEVLLSIFGAFFSIGMIFGAAFYPIIKKHVSARLLLSIGGYSLGGFYILLVVIGYVVQKEILLFFLLAVLSFMIGMNIAMMSSYFQIEFMKNVEEAFLARASAVLGAVGVAAIPVCSFFISILVRFVDTGTIFIIAGIFDFLICFKLYEKKRFIILEQKEQVIRSEENQSGKTC